MFFFLDVPKWVLVLAGIAIATILGIVIWLVRSNVTVAGGAVEYMDGYEAGTGKSTDSAKRIERTVAPKTGFELQPGQQPYDPVIKRDGTTNRRSVPSQNAAPPVSDGGRGRGGRN